MRSPETWYVEWDLTTLPIPDLAVACLFGACSNGRTLRYGGIRLRRTRTARPPSTALVNGAAPLCSASERS